MSDVNTGGGNSSPLSLEEQLQILEDTGIIPTDENGNIFPNWIAASEIYGNRTNDSVIPVDYYQHVQDMVRPPSEYNMQLQGYIAGIDPFAENNTESESEESRPEANGEGLAAQISQHQDFVSAASEVSNSDMIEAAGLAMQSSEEVSESLTEEEQAILEEGLPDIDASEITVESTNDSEGDSIFNRETLNRRIDAIYDANLLEEAINDAPIPEIAPDSNEELEKLILEMGTILTANHGTNWDAINTTSGYLQIIIKYPEVTVVNSEGNTVTIKDLYVRFKFKRESNTIKLVNSIQGTRMHMDYKSWKKQYCHSHLGSNAMHQFADFCLGTTILNTLVGDLQYEGITLKTINKFESLIALITELTQWESIEGVPYIYMRVLNEPLRSRDVEISINDKEAAFNSFRNLCETRRLNHEFQFDFNEGRVEYILNESIEDWLVDCTPHHQAKKDNGRFYNPVDLPVDVEPFEDSNMTSFIFKGEEIKRKVEGMIVNTTWPPHVKKYANRQITKYILNRINEISNILLINLIHEKTRKDRANERANNRRNTFIQDYIPVYSS